MKTACVNFGCTREGVGSPPAFFVPFQAGRRMDALLDASKVRPLAYQVTLALCAPPRAYFEGSVDITIRVEVATPMFLLHASGLSISGACFVPSGTRASCLQVRKHCTCRKAPDLWRCEVEVGRAFVFWCTGVARCHLHLNRGRAGTGNILSAPVLWRQRATEPYRRYLRVHLETRPHILVRLSARMRFRGLG